MSNQGSGQGVYSPLPQTITDSESEEELHNSISTRNQILQKERHNKIIKNGMTPFDHYPACEETEDPNGYTLGLDNNIENINILQDEKKPTRMSPMRRFFFVFSIVVCFLTIIIFLWVLPCSELGECMSASLHRMKTPSWENPYHDIELKGAINIVDGALGHDKNLIMLFRGDVVNPEHSEGVRSSNDNGILLIVGNSGKVGWFIRQPRLPTDIDCSLIDVDKDGLKDCIMVGKEGLFAAFSPMTGTVYWYLHNHEANGKPFESVDFPLVIMDIDGDGVNDMLAPCSTSDQNHNALVFVSGYQGSVIGQPLVITECTSLNKLQIDKDHTVSYTCKNNTSLFESLKDVTLGELYKSITNKPYNPKWNDWVVTKQHQVYGQRKETENQRNIYSVDGRKLIVENQGHCPKKCKVTVQLIDERSGKENISWEYGAARVYGMVPATLVFNNSANILKHHISGFVLKFWQWNVGNRKNRFDRKADSNTYSIFNNILQPPPTETPEKGEIHRRYTRKILQSKKNMKSDNITINRLTERVVLVTFNSTDIHIVNASQSDVIQICFTENKETICQPDLSYQENSLLISDLDGDGSQELITYLTSFICPEALDEFPTDIIKCDEDWKLRSTVRVVRLEAELPKLYEAVSHH